MDTFASAFAEAVADLNMGHGLDDNVQVGPLINGAGAFRNTYHQLQALTFTNDYAPCLQRSTKSSATLTMQYPKAPSFSVAAGQRLCGFPRKCQAWAKIDDCLSYCVPLAR